MLILAFIFPIQPCQLLRWASYKWIFNGPCPSICSIGFLAVNFVQTINALWEHSFHKPWITCLPWTFVNVLFFFCNSTFSRVSLFKLLFVYAIDLVIYCCKRECLTTFTTSFGHALFTYWLHCLASKSLVGHVILHLLIDSMSSNTEKAFVVFQFNFFGSIKRIFKASCCF